MYFFLFFGGISDESKGRPCRLESRDCTSVNSMKCDNHYAKKKVEKKKKTLRTTKQVIIMAKNVYFKQS